MKFLLGKRTIRHGTTLTALLIAPTMPYTLRGKAAPTICSTFSPATVVILQRAMPAVSPGAPACRNSSLIKNNLGAST